MKIIKPYVELLNYTVESEYKMHLICSCSVAHDILRYDYFEDVEERQLVDPISINFILPCWFSKECKNELIKKEQYLNIDDFDDHFDTPDFDEWAWIMHVIQSEIHHKNAIQNGWRPQYAYQFLPRSLRTDLIITGGNGEWLNFFEDNAFNGVLYPQRHEIAQLAFDKYLEVTPDGH